MALSKPTMKSTIKAKMDSIMGTADDDGKRSDFAEAMADAVYDILTAQAATLLNNGLDSNGDTLVNLTGKVV